MTRCSPSIHRTIGVRTSAENLGAYRMRGVIRYMKFSSPFMLLWMMTIVIGVETVACVWMYRDAGRSYSTFSGVTSLNAVFVVSGNSVFAVSFTIHPFLAIGNMTNVCP